MLKANSDGFPEDYPRFGNNFTQMYDALELKTKPLFKKMLTSGCLSADESRRHVTCIIADGFLGFNCDVSKEIGVPIIHVRTLSHFGYKSSPSLLPTLDAYKKLQTSKTPYLIVVCAATNRQIMDRVKILPRVLIFPFPAQGHVNSMLKLAELLCLAGINITFLVSYNIYHRLLRHTNIKSRFKKYPGFHLESLPDGIDENNIHAPGGVQQLYNSFQSILNPFLRELFFKNPAGIGIKPPVTSIIADGILSVALEVAEEFGVPVIYFRTISASAFWTYFCIPQLIEAGELPFSRKDMDIAIANVKGMEGFLRRRDLPSFCRVDDLTSPDFDLLLNETQQSPRAKGLILNTFDDLEGPILSHIRTHCPNLYTIGPLHAHLKTRLAAQSYSNSLWEEDRSCIDWLGKQASKSVLYVSFGSITVISREKLLEFWHGLVNSGVRFLWVIRPDSIIGKDDQESKPTPDELELEEGTKARGYMVGWTPQEEVLAHPAVGGFLTHGGWNSTLESIVEGVPMICWPYFADQQTNSRMVGKVWNIGLDMKDTCDRVIVEKTIRDVMEVRNDEFMHRADQMAKLAKKGIEEGGSSFCNLERLIQDIMN